MRRMLPIGRPAREGRAPTAARLTGAVLAAAAVCAVLRIATGVRRELRDHRARVRRLPSAWTSIDGIAGGGRLAIHARLADDARTALPPIVLVHGLGVAGSYLLPLAEHLADAAHVYVPDLPGHGASDHDARPLTVRELGDALAAWMEARGLRAAVLVGHSLGAQIVADVATRHASLASALVLIAPTSDPHARTIASVLARAARTAPFERPTFAIWGALDYARAGPRVLATELRELIAHRIEDALPRIAVPVRVVRAANDRVVPQRWAESAAALAGAPPPSVIARWGHAAPYDAPAAVARLVLALATAAAHRAVHERRGALPSVPPA